ncbi:hypothetical protein RJT34_17442 [Clitoria ternatea]|uniref:Uncharacterized protein n=1 Tax=Clitoria ternatea TaxID=43366 RepID=A0AAN9JB56_CLITE
MGRAMKIISIGEPANISTISMAELQNNIKYKQGTKVDPSKRKGNGISSKCASLVKEQRTRLYILRRCATMLLCWYIQGDD